jgi:C4-type Zn-finger protein
MTIEQSDRPCPDCEQLLQVIYVTELEQVVSGWACPDCGYLVSKRDGIEDSVAKPDKQEYTLRIEKPLGDSDVRTPLATVEDEFRARARAEMADDEVWLLIDPAEETVVDARVGDEAEESES